MTNFEEFLPREVRLTVAQAAVAIGKTERAIYKWVQTGRVKAVKDAAGRSSIRWGDLLDAESSVRRGRPSGTPTRR